MAIGEGVKLPSGEPSFEVDRMLAATAETIEGVSFNLELLWERLQQPDELPRERVRSAVWAAVMTLRECGGDLDATSQALADMKKPRPRPEG